MRRAFAFVFFSLAASCGMLVPNASDAGFGADAPPDGFVSTPCNTAADCPSGTDCLYPTKGGCAAKKTCLPTELHCKLEPACTCDGVNVAACEVGMTAPIKHIGMCTPDCTSGTACEACDMSGYVSPTMGMPRIVPNACTQTELASFVSACFGSAQSQTACNAWHAVDAGPCAICLATALQSASQWGPFDCASTSVCDPNAGGCIDAILGTISQEHGQGGASSCGDLFTSTNTCIDYACATCGPGDMQTCAEAALAAECKSYGDAQSSTTGPCAAIANDAAPPSIARCFPKTDADNVAFLNVFCGTGP